MEFRSQHTSGLLFSLHLNEQRALGVGLIYLIQGSVPQYF